MEEKGIGILAVCIWVQRHTKLQSVKLPHYVKIKDYRHSAPFYLLERAVTPDEFFMYTTNEGVDNIF